MLGMVCGSLWLAFIAPTTSSTSKDAKNITLSIDRNLSIYSNIKYKKWKIDYWNFHVFILINYIMENKRDAGFSSNIRYQCMKKLKQQPISTPLAILLLPSFLQLSFYISQHRY